MEERNTEDKKDIEELEIIRRKINEEIGEETVKLFKNTADYGINKKNMGKEGRKKNKEEKKKIQKEIEKKVKKEVEIEIQIEIIREKLNNKQQSVE